MLVEEILQQLTLTEKAGLLSQFVWETSDLGSQKLTNFLLADGPVGLRRLKEMFDEDIYNTVPSTCYPSVSAYASSWDPQLIFELGRHLGREAQQEAVDVVLGPGVNIKRSPLGGRNFEYYSEDPYLTGELATAFIQGIQSEGVGACLKHFAVNNQETRRMTINAVINEEALREIYLRAFEKPIMAGQPWLVMTAYNQVNGQFCANSDYLLKQVLREEWGYQGAVITDCYAAHELAAAIKNGLTMQMPGEKGPRLAQRIEELLAAGAITEAELDRAVLTNMRFAEKCAAERRGGQYDREQHHAFARQVAEEGAVLLKNEGQILPLAASDKLAVIGEFAERPRFQGGGSSHVNPYRLAVPLTAIRKIATDCVFAPGYKTEPVSVETAVELRKQACEAAANADKVVVFLGLPELSESEGYDRQELQLPPNQLALLADLTAVNSRVVVVLANGSVVDTSWAAQISGLLEMYLGGEAVGSAAANLLFGKVNPSGRLAETFPKALTDTPAFPYFPGDTKQVCYGEGKYVGYRYYEKVGKETAFPFGYGLSYTSFQYSGLQLADDRSWLKVTVRNTGQVSGKEVVQAYVAKDGYVQLAGFTKLLLAAGEAAEVTLPIDSKVWQYFDCEAGSWRGHFGDFQLYVGRSVKDRQLQIAVTLPKTNYLYTENSCLGDIVDEAAKRAILTAAFQEHPISLQFLNHCDSSDPLTASMGTLMSLNTLKRIDDTLTEQAIAKLITTLNS